MARGSQVAAGLTCIVFSSTLAWAQSAAPVLTLADTVKEALVHNERIVNQGDAIAQADLGLRLARNTFKPKVTPNIFGSFGRTDVSSQTYRVDVSHGSSPAPSCGCRPEPRRRKSLELSVMPAPTCSSTTPTPR